ncbi:GuaB3 family IMP dehydrogenase-related protein [bacterium]|nr:GuaB3 family IMP dehydrogenase-related protein [bacterium]MBU1153875.1 GuaB3 family IMP dehydrogenase-related protein [bacterium]MBU1782404.1 GuaB3 family IMP dehydrogenase-related protein [bacterium]
MGVYIGRGRKARRGYGFDEIALVPGLVPVNPEDVAINFKLRDFRFEVPIIAAAMDGVTDVNFAIHMSKLGGLAVLNLEGIYTRYEDPAEIINDIVKATPQEATNIIQKMYLTPVKEELIEKKIKEMKAAQATVAVSSIPQKAEMFGEIAQQAGADIFVVQATITSARYLSSDKKSLNFKDFCQKMKIPVIVGNCVTYESALGLMECGIDGLLVGVGPGSACTTRGVLGIGVPQVTATADCAAARDFYFNKTSRYVPIITDGGMSVGGDICKAFSSGADAVMIGSAFAKSKEAPGKGYHWGMATPHKNLPRGTRIYVGVTSSLEEILFGPAHLDDGSQNLVGALKTSMGMCGARNIREMQLSEIIIAPSIKTEGKIFQKSQHIGMGRS